MRIWFSDKSLSEVDRARIRIEEFSTPIPEAGCWLWTNAVNQCGYGTMNAFGTTTMAHRVSYRVFRGTDPGSLNVCHKCDTPSCVNPDHLFLGTRTENMLDMYGKRRRSQLGSRNGNAKLSEPQVLEILRSSEPSSVLAVRYGVSHAAIWMIRKGHNWKRIAA